MGMRSPIASEIVAPFPITERNEIINGFGRGSSELGIPTANIPVTERLAKLEPGIYFGYCRLSPSQKPQEIKLRQDGQQVLFNQGNLLADEDLQVWPMVMSIGYNPFYSNKEKTAEIHVVHEFSHDFYGANITYVVLGYIRPELDYTTKQALIEDINLDIKLALEALNSAGYRNASNWSEEL